MAKRISLVTIFVLFNMGIGRMFQESLGASCFSELSILAITSFFFWNSSARQIKKWGAKWLLTSSGRNLFIQGGLGLSVSALNIIIGQLLVIVLMTQVYQCTSPSFSMLNASLTNNIGVNLLCYFTLLFYFIHIDKKDPEAEEEMEGTERPHRVSVSKRGLQFLLEPQQIVYVETSNNCVVLHTEKGKFVKYQSLKSFSNELCSKSFRRVHRSYLVNADFVEHIQKNHSGDGRLYLSTGDQIRFSRTYQEEVRQI